MDKIKIFVGQPASGKSRKARELCEGIRFAWIMGRKDTIKNPFILYAVGIETKLIVVDDIPNEKVLKKWLCHFMNDMLIVNIKAKKSFQMPRPEIILICDFESFKPTEASIAFRVEVINFEKEVSNG